MKLKIDRSAVCAGDDSEPHDEIRRFEPGLHVGAMLAYVAASGFLPAMSDSACWIVRVDNTPLAVISGSGEEILLASGARTPLGEIVEGGEASVIFFEYESRATAWEMFGRQFLDRDAVIVRSRRPAIS